jgi:hypothetical protein
VEEEPGVAASTTSHSDHSRWAADRELQGGTLVDCRISERPILLPASNRTVKPRFVVILVALLALAAKLYCAVTTIGTSDVVTFYNFAQYINERGLIALYQDTPLFNHTPLVGWYAAFAYRMADAGRSPGMFAFLLRLPGILADLGAVAAVLWRREKTGRPAWWALALFAASPVAFMVSGYHGNVDSVMALGVLLAGLACEFGSPAVCGLFLGLSCNIKIIPVFLAPAFFFFWLHRGRVWSFSLPAVAAVLIGWAEPLLSIPRVFLKDVLGYSSVWGVWGITFGLRLTGLPSFQVINYTNEPAAQVAISLGLKVFIVVTVLAIAWFRRRADSSEIFTLLALSWAVFFVFAPGFGAQYLVWLAPCLLLASARWYAAFTVASSVALFVFYDAISHGMPWFSGFTVHKIVSQWAPALVLPWTVLAAFVWSFGRHLRISERPRVPT